MYGFQEIDPSTLARWQQEGVALRLVDVRTPAEVARGIIPAGESIPLHLLPIFPPRVEAGEKLVFYCQSGARSAQACLFMSQRGATEAYNLAGGILAWVREGHPMIAPAPRMMAG